jgi:hypothetical protein
MLNNFINHSGIFPSNEINNYNINNKEREINKSVDLLYDILNIERKGNINNYKENNNNKKITEVGYSYNNFIDKNKNNNMLNNNRNNKKGK